MDDSRFVRLSGRWSAGVSTIGERWGSDLGSVGGRFLQKISTGMSELSGQGSGTALIVVFRPQAVDAYPPVGLLYYPFLNTAKEPSASVFEAGEVAEFQQRDYAKAITVFRELSQSKDPAIRAGALLRLGRNLRKAQQPSAALDTLVQMVIPEPPQNLIGDNAYDSDKLDTGLRRYGIELISPHRRNRKNKTQDLRRLRRYRKRWKIERLFAWLQNFRRLVVRYERHAENFLGMLYLGCCVILLRHI
jgi:transposase